MGEKENTDEKKQITSSIKSHEEILELFEEIEEIEQELIHPDFDSQPNQNNTSKEKQKSPETVNHAPFIASVDKDRKKKKSLKTLFKPFKKKKSKKSKDKKVLKLRKSSKPKTSKKKIFKKKKKTNKTNDKTMDPSKSTFTLKLDTSGNLVGLEVKKAQKPQQKFSLKTVFKKKTKNSDSEKSQSSDVKGLKALPVKLKGLLSHIPFLSKKISNKDKSTSDSKTSTLSSIPKKIKGIFSKK